MESYLPVGRPDPPLSCKPVHTYNGPQFPLENSTVTQLSFLPPEMPPRETPPWAVRAGYQPPDAAMEGNTIYNGSFLPPGTFEPCESSTTYPNTGRSPLQLTLFKILNSGKRGGGVYTMMKYYS